MTKQVLLVVALIFSFIVFMSFLYPHQYDAKASFHSPQEIAAFRTHRLATIGPGEYFLYSEHCRGCHGYDFAQVANVDENGNTVNLFDHWQSTMMANSARDPLWRAKVSHEILVNPAHAEELQDKCTSCHAPMGKYNSFYHGIAHFGLADLATDTLGLDGVACESCHTIGPDVGLTFSGVIPYDTTRNVYGPFVNPFAGPMQLYEGYTPTYSDHMNQARVCSSCHTLITQSVDTSGVFTGGIFVEQATYHEYLNSQFPADTITCQTCHMPHLTNPVIIANGFLNLQQRFPFNQHMFAGANSFMLKMIRDNRITLGAGASAAQFDSTIDATIHLLRDSSIVFSLHSDSVENNIAYFHVRIQNRAGHKFPSGYPSRRAVIQFVATDAVGDTLLKSGTFTNDFHVKGENPSFEPHHNIISQSDVPQIYELVMGDVNSNFTTVLERAAILLKDNRIPPVGFTTASPVYDTVMISNDALADSDFNKVNSVQGSGVDLVHYQVPVAGAVGSISVHASVYYQSVPPKWVQPLLAFNSAEIDTFRNMYNNADKSPLLMASDSIVNLLLPSDQNLSMENDIEVYPTLTGDGKVYVKSPAGIRISHIDVYTTDGKKVINKDFSSEINICSILLPPAKSVYLMKIQSGSQVFYRKIIRQ